MPLNIGLHIRHALRFVKLYRSRKSSHIIGYPPDPFPAELWMQIIDECWSHWEWLHLCKTCRFFFQVAQAFLYEDITLNRFRPDKRSFGHPLSLFEKSFKNRPELGAFVHNLALVDLPTFPKRKSKPKLLLLSCLHQFPNLKELRLHNLEDYIDSDLCYAIHSHPRLSSVSFSLCRLEKSLTPLCNQQFPESSISHLDILDLHQERHPWAAFAPTRLRNLSVSGYFGYYFAIEDILSSLISSGKCHWLERLSMGFLYTSFAHFLITTPQLRHLTIDCDVLDDDPIFSSLPMDAIPLLEHFAGPVELSTLILRNRPVHTVVLTRAYGIPMHSVIFASLQLPSVPVTKLEVFYCSAGTWLRDVPITIRDLTILVGRESPMEFSPYLSHLTDLHTICCKNDVLVMLSVEEIIQISKVCPSLREFDKTGLERWVMVKPSVWERFTCP